MDGDYLENLCAIMEILQMLEIVNFFNINIWQNIKL
jgi:hypothetical protein